MFEARYDPNHFWKFLYLSQIYMANLSMTNFLLNQDTEQEFD